MRDEDNKPKRHPIMSDYQLILGELKRLNANVEKLVDKVHKNEKDIAVMRVKSGFWGSLSGTITVIIAFMIESFIRKS